MKAVVLCALVRGLIYISSTLRVLRFRVICVICVPRDFWDGWDLGDLGDVPLVINH